MRLHDYFDFSAREYPDTPFAILGDRTMTYREAAAEVNRLAHALIGAGLQPGDRIAVLSKNSIEYAVMYYAASKAGVVPVPMNYRLAPPEWTYIINDAGAKLIMASSAYAGAIDDIKGDLDHAKTFVCVGGDAPSGWHAYRAFVDGQPATPHQPLPCPGTGTALR